MVFVFAIMAVHDMNGADSQRAYAGDVKNVYNHIDIINTHWACWAFVHSYPLMMWNPPLDSLCLNNYGSGWHER